MSNFVFRPYGISAMSNDVRTWQGDLPPPFLIGAPVLIGGSVLLNIADRRYFNTGVGGYLVLGSLGLVTAWWLFKGFEDSPAGQQAKEALNASALGLLLHPKKWWQREIQAVSDPKHHIAAIASNPIGAYIVKQYIDLKRGKFILF